ncbi:hypothetical protein EV356DRAFT_563635 [Viridothelium virens]|uniref:F-box domain-containing protein n=1 Tax=Viridothelium virens TaxID=1048519 RepID=A0A6A6HM75_VIRVR|nr:hypothetical protein EV356DRAFT_563635 [Viridothelium virens]
MTSMLFLEGLPNEILDHILGYLIGPFCGRPGATGLDWPDPVPSSNKYESAVNVQPLFQLAMVSRHLNTLVEDFCRRLLFQYQSIGLLKSSKDGVIHATKGSRPVVQIVSKRKEAHRCVWVKWSRQHCVFCGKKSVRRAVFNNQLRCCQSCDRKRFPEKITMTAAMNQFDLKRHHLFKHAVYRGGYWEYGSPNIRCAAYDCQGVLTRLFFRSDVAELARRVHGDFDAHMRVREERRRKLAEKKQHYRALGY